jgi:hypothetical protein
MCDLFCITTALQKLYEGTKLVRIIIWLQTVEIGNLNASLVTFPLSSRGLVKLRLVANRNGRWQ